MAFSDWARQTEVPDLGNRFRSEENVSGLDVTVQDAVLVSVGQTMRNAGYEANRFFLVDRSSIGGMVERLTLNQLHDDVEHPISITKIIDGNQVGVVEAGHRFGLGFKARSELRVRSKLTGKDFDRDRTVEGNLPGGVDSTHPSLRDERSDLVCRKVRL